MATIKLNSPLCIYCYKQASFTKDTNKIENTHAHSIPQRFLELIFRTFNTNYTALSKLQCTNCCDDCLGILKPFCDLYHQIKCLELKLNWQVDKLLNVMRWADRVPSRLKSFKSTENFDNKVKFRKCLRRKFKQHLSNSFPRVSLSHHKSGIIPKTKNQVTELNNEDVVELDVISIATEDCINFSVKDCSKTECFLLGWLTTLSALIFLCHLKIPKENQAQDDPKIVSLEVNDEYVSELPQVAQVSQANAPMVSDHDDNGDDDFNLPEFGNNEFEQALSTCSVDIQVIKKEYHDNEPKTGEKAPQLMSTSLQTEHEQVKSVTVKFEQTRNKKTALSYVPAKGKEFNTLSIVDCSNNSISRHFSADSTKNTNLSSVSSFFNEETEAVICIPDRRRLRTKYQCSNCKATFSDVHRLDRHQQDCLSTNEADLDLHLENDKDAELLTEHETKYDGELSSYSEEYSNDELKLDMEKSDLRSKSSICRQRSKFTRERNRIGGKVNVKKNTTTNAHLCTKCKPHMSFQTILTLKKHEYYKHSNGRITIEKHQMCKVDIKTIRIKGLSIKPKYTCPKSKCGTTFLLSQELENHTKVHDKFTCSVCDLTVNHAVSLIDHELEHSNENQKLANPDFRNGEIFACTRCDYKTQVKKEFVNHFLGDHLSVPVIKSKCPICQHEFLYVNNVPLAHFINFHDINRLDDPDNTVLCTEPDCSAYFLTEDQLHLHWNRQHVSGCTSKESNVLMERKIAKRKKQLNKERSQHKNHVCSQCQKTFFRGGDLRVHVIRAHVRKMGYKHADGLLGNFVISKEGITINDIVLEENAKYFCEIDNCQEQFREKADFDRHSKLHGEFPCKFCETITPFALDLAIHEMIHVTENEKNGAYNERSVLRLKVFKCSRCPFKMGNRGRYLDHFVRMHLDLESDRKKCPICNFVFETDTYKKPHMATILKDVVHRHYMDWHDFTDSEDAAQKCDKCSAHFKTKLQLLYHTDEEHNTEKLKCKGLWNNVCSDCGKQFAGKTGLRIHRKLVHKVDCKFGCEVEGCLKKFETVRQLMHHDLMNHLSKEMFICSECGKSFFSNVGLTAHRKSHEKKVKIVKKHHVCDKCGKSFKDKPKLKQHYRFHEGRETWEFECEICRKKLSSKQKLNEHMRTHTKEKPFVCQVCGVAYAHRHNLRIHTNSKHKEVEDVGSKRVSENFASWRKGKKLK